MAKRYHFIGIGGAGMAPLAQLLLERGHAVSGSDAVANAKTAKLAELGAQVFCGHCAEQLPKVCDAVVYSSAVTADNPEYAAAARRGLPLLRRGEMLAEFSASYRRVAAVSGSHGKSSITAMLVHALRKTGHNPGFMIGAQVNGGPSAAAGDGDVLVTEADESDATHKLLHPYLGIIPNVDDDHAWSVGGADALTANFRTFANNCQRLLFWRTPQTEAVLCVPEVRTPWTCLPLPSDGFAFAGFQGFQAVNAQLAVAAAGMLGVDLKEAETAVRSFPGIARRMTVRYASPELTVIEDYAHHPAEVAASVKLLRRKYPQHHLRLLFQPHRYARLERYFDDFARVLKTADSVLVTPVFAAWCESGRVDSAALAQASGGTAVELPWSRIAESALANRPERPLLLAVLGAGDVEEVFSFLPRN